MDHVEPAEPHEATIPADATKHHQGADKVTAAPPGVQAQLVWIRTARDIYDTLTTVNREEAVALLAYRLQHVAESLAAVRIEDTLKVFRSLLEPKGNELAALGQIADSLLVALYDRNDDPTPSRNKVLRALKAARDMKPPPAPAPSWWSRLLAGLRGT